MRNTVWLSFLLAATASNPAAFGYGLEPVVCINQGGTVTSEFVTRFIGNSPAIPHSHSQTPPRSNELVLDINTKNGIGSGLKCSSDLAGASITGVHGQFKSFSFDVSGDCNGYSDGGPIITLVGINGSNSQIQIAAFTCNDPDKSIDLGNGFFRKTYSRTSSFGSPSCMHVVLPSTVVNVYIAVGPGQHTQIKNVLYNGSLCAPDLTGSLRCVPNFTIDGACDCN